MTGKVRHTVRGEKRALILMHVIFVFIVGLITGNYITFKHSGLLPATCRGTDEQPL